MAYHPKKRLGQHFLRDPQYVARIIRALAPRAGDLFLEIGPGTGALTLPLLRAVGTMTAIELDRDLIPRLAQAAAPVGQLRIIAGNILDTDLAALADDARLRIVGNLPYYISSPILFHCLAHADATIDMHFMLQKEVVERMAARPGNKTYGRLSVMLQRACRVEPLFEVPREAFAPAPDVDSAVVRLVPLPAGERPCVDAKCLDTVVKTAFGQRRKTLGNALRSVLQADVLRQHGIDPGLRAEALAPGDFARLAQVLAARLA